MFIETNRLTLQYLAIASGVYSLAIGLTLATVSFYTTASTISLAWPLLGYGIVAPVTATVLFLFGSCCFALAWLPLSSHHTILTGLGHFLILVVIRVMGAYRLHVQDKATKDPRKYQDQLLKKILSDNANTEYGKLNNFCNIKDREDFRAQHPLTSYETYRRYIDRISEKGEQNLLTKDRVVRFNVSSGTTGKCKFLPYTAVYFPTLMKYTITPILYMLATCKKEAFLSPLKMSLMMFLPRWRFTAHNMPIGPASGFTSNQRSRLLTLGRTLPLEADEFMSESGQCYLHWLFALYDRELVRIDGTFGGAILSNFEFLQKAWPQLVADIRQGRITRGNEDIPPDVIENIEKAGRLWPDPKRAGELQAEFSAGFEGIAGRIWPRLNILVATVTGAQSIYCERLRWYFGPNVKFYTWMLGASEGHFGMNMDPLADEQLFTLQPHMTFMEFIPEREVTAANPPTLFMDQLELGQRYEMVITTILGFYRYRIGDIVEVARLRHSKTPVVRFCGRVGSILDLRGEKTSEDMILTALKRSIPSWKGCSDLADYTTTDSVSFAKAVQTEQRQEVGLHYVLFIEATEGLSRQLTADEIAAFDGQLTEVSFPFKSFRSKKSIGEPKIYVVKAGTFGQMKEATLKRNDSISNQYKTPRYITDEDRIRFLLQSSY